MPKTVSKGGSKTHHFSCVAFYTLGQRYFVEKSLFIFQCRTEWLFQYESSSLLKKKLFKIKEYLLKTKLNWQEKLTLRLKSTSSSQNQLWSA